MPKNSLLSAIPISWAFLGAPLVQAQQVNWGSPVLSSIVDSGGSVLDNTYVFELGTFANGFTPSSSNLGSWFDNWRVFDAAEYNQALGYYTGTASLTDTGSSTSPDASPFNFGGQEAYVWVRNSNTMVEQGGSEWFLARSQQWVFEDAFPGCCDNPPPVDWSLSNLQFENVTPIYGSQSSLKGAGNFTVDGNFSLQTYTLIPEPSTVMLAAGGMFALVLRRRRSA